MPIFFKLNRYSNNCFLFITGYMQESTMGCRQVNSGSDMLLYPECWLVLVILWLSTRVVYQDPTRVPYLCLLCIVHTYEGSLPLSSNIYIALLKRWFSFFIRVGMYHVDEMRVLFLFTIYILFENKNVFFCLKCILIG